MSKMILGLVVTLAMASAACSGSGSSGASMAETEVTALPPIKVDLPPPPSFAEANRPVKNPDGSYNVRGLRKMRAETLGKEATVKGFLVEVYECPTCPKGQTCKLCDQPHFFLGDKPDTKKEKALMVVDYLLPKQKPPALTVGKEYVVSGSFSINSPTGFGSSDGLLIFGKMVDDRGTEFLSQATQLEEKAMAGEAIEAAFAAKRAAAKRGK